MEVSARAAELAGQWNSLPVIVCEANHEGTLPPTMSGMSCEGAAITAVKPAEDGSGCIVRLTGVSDMANLRVGASEYTIPAAPQKIITLRVAENGISQTDMLEGL